MPLSRRLAGKGPSGSERAAQSVLRAFDGGVDPRSCRLLGVRGLAGVTVGEDLERVSRPVLLDLRRVAIIVALGVGHEPVGVELQERGPVLSTHVSDTLARDTQ